MDWFLHANGLRHERVNWDPKKVVNSENKLKSWKLKKLYILWRTLIELTIFLYASWKMVS